MGNKVSTKRAMVGMINQSSNEQRI